MHIWMSPSLYIDAPTGFPIYATQYAPASALHSPVLCGDAYTSPVLYAPTWKAIIVTPWLFLSHMKGIVFRWILTLASIRPHNGHDFAFFGQRNVRAELSTV